jgi:GNAT superfamily N-acetyltransferase
VAPDLLAAVRLVPLGPQSAVLIGPWGEDGEAAALVPEAVGRARALDLEAVSHRPQKVGPKYRAALEVAGFRDLGERVEYKTPVAELPDDDGSPLAWQDLRKIGIDEAAAVLARAAEGDPTGDAEREDARAALTELLADPLLTDGPECVQVGFEGDRPVAFLCVQIIPKTGWSRISYMGVVPEARGRGLGKWVHRHGFRMIREQGGTLYQGGTSTVNGAMIRLFETHGCQEFERMLDFEWTG